MQHTESVGENRGEDMKTDTWKELACKCQHMLGPLLQTWFRNLNLGLENLFPERT